MSCCYKAHALMKIYSKSAKAALGILLCVAHLAFCCSLVDGYFYQVTCLRGTVVGVNDGDIRHISRWMRQQVVREDAKLTLYQFRRPITKSWSELPLVKRVESDTNGKFDFGPVPVGHYTLTVETQAHFDKFDVQIVNSSKQTRSVTLDISPIYPDCTGGHEFIVNTAKP